MGSWYVYMVRCKDNSLYTGITTDISRRLTEHNGSRNGARYTRSRRPVSLVYMEKSSSKSTAAQREYTIKQLNKKAKEQLIASTPLLHLNNTTEQGKEKYYNSTPSEEQ